MTTIASTLDVAHSNLIERRMGSSRPRGRYHKAEDNRLLPLIRQLVGERPSYGYRRITALLNRRLQGQDLPKVNAKRVLRILQKHGLTLQRHTGRQLGRTHDGMVVALTSNIRWCSDHFELTCRNGEIVRILFAIDACDREIVAWSATTVGISGQMVQDLMVACVERRFDSLKTPHPVEWLSDNGSAYIAKDTRNTATALGLRLCFTPVRSPQSPVSSADITPWDRPRPMASPRPS
jgi:putative transposase